jgi:hypothetical protein
MRRGSVATPDAPADHEDVDGARARVDPGTVPEALAAARQALRAAVNGRADLDQLAQLVHDVRRRCPTMCDRNAGAGRARQGLARDTAHDPRLLAGPDVGPVDRFRLTWYGAQTRPVGAGTRISHPGRAACPGKGGTTTGPDLTPASAYPGPSPRGSMRRACA